MADPNWSGEVTKKVGNFAVPATGVAHDPHFGWVCSPCAGLQDPHKAKLEEVSALYLVQYAFTPREPAPWGHSILTLCVFALSLPPRRRWLVFDATEFSLKWAETQAKAATPKGVFKLDPSKISYALSEENKRPNEIKVVSGADNKTLFFCTVDAAAADALLMRIDAARRSLVASVENSTTFRSMDEVLKEPPGFFAGEPGAKVFTWGVGMLLGIGKADVNGMAVPQRVQAFKAR